MTTIDQILSVLKEGLAAWKTFIATREEAYKRSMDKRLRAALEAGEKYILTDTDANIKEDRKQKLKAHYKKRFFHYN